MTSSEIPTVDISITQGNSPSIECLQDVGNQVVEALHNVGFVYIVNHGIDDQLIQTTFSKMKAFFELPEEVKMKYCRNWEKSFCGYMPYKDDKHKNIEVEHFDKTRPAERKEILDLCHNCSDEQWPAHESLGEDFRSATYKLIAESQELTRKLMLLTGYGMKLKDPATFVKGFAGFLTEANTTCKLRSVLYPSVKQESDILPGQLRCGEHTDFGTFTLLFLDSTPGLQVFNRQGYYQNVDSLDGGILLNLGGMMQRWSGDYLHAAKHRVVFRPDTMFLPRQSLVYFTSPDDDFPVKPVLGDETLYPPITALDHLTRRYNDTFRLGEGIDDELNREYL